MRRSHVSMVEPGQKLGKTIFSADGRVLIASGVELNLSMLEKLRDFDIHEIYIDDEISQGVEVNDVVSDRTRIETRRVVKDLMGSFQFSKSMDTSAVRRAVEKLIDELLSNPEIIINLTDIKSVDDYTFEHSVNVAVLSIITGMDLGYNQNRLKELGVGALLHDVGKLRIPEHILKKPAQLTVEEFEEIKKHTVYGYELLKRCDNISLVSAFIALAHHERFDGSGYPLQLKGTDIHECARIVAIADVYDALTSDRVYRQKLRPGEVVQYITSLGSHHFDANLVQNFVRYIALYPVGTGVMLNTKEKGLVIYVNKELPTRPVVRIIYDAEGFRLPVYRDVDLSGSMNLFITEPCDL